MTAPPEERREAKTTATQLRRSLRYLTAATLVLALVLLGAGIKVYLDGRDTKDALCTLRFDLATRALAATAYLKEHPNGAPGIPAKQVLESIYNQQRTIVALKDLNCDKPPQETLDTIPTPPPNGRVP